MNRILTDEEIITGRNEWIASRPACVQEAAKRFPLGSPLILQDSTDDIKYVLAGYREICDCGNNCKIGTTEKCQKTKVSDAIFMPTEECVPDEAEANAMKILVPLEKLESRRINLQ